MNTLGAGSSLGGKGKSNIRQTMVSGGYLPGVYENKSGAVGKGVRSITDIASQGAKNNIATEFRKTKK